MNLNKHIFQSSIMVPLARTILIIVCATAACVEAFIVTIPGRFPRVTGTRVGRPGEGSNPHPLMFSSSGSSGRTRVGKRGASKLLKSQEISTSLDATAKGGDTATVNISPRQKRARVVVRQAKEADYEQVASIRAVIIPVGMDGATGFMGKKVVIKDPAEAKRRRLMAKGGTISVTVILYSCLEKYCWIAALFEDFGIFVKVADLVSGEAVSLIALEGGRIVGTVDCTIQNSCDKLGVKTDSYTSGYSVRGRRIRQVAARKSLRPRMFLSNLFVLPEHRRRGIARELVKGAEAFARRKGAEALCLEVESKNMAAMELYRSCSFQEKRQPRSTEGGMGDALLRSLGLGKRFMSKNI